MRWSLEELLEKQHTASTWQGAPATTANQKGIQRLLGDDQHPILPLPLHLFSILTPSSAQYLATPLLLLHRPPRLRALHRELVHALRHIDSHDERDEEEGDIAREQEEALLGRE